MASGARESRDETAKVTKEGSKPTFSRNTIEQGGSKMVQSMRDRGLTEAEAMAAITGKPTERKRHEQVADAAAADREEADDRLAAAEAGLADMLENEDPNAGQGDNEIELPIDEDYDDEDEELEDDEDFEDEESEEFDEADEERRQRLETLLEEAEIDPNEVTVTVKIDGVDEEISLQDAINDYSGQAASTRRFQEAAALRKAAEQELEGISAIQRDYTQRLSQLGAIAENLQNDPQAQQLLQQFEQEYQRVSREQQALTAARRQRHLQQEAQRVVEIMPEWSEPETRKADRALIDSYASSIGLSAEDVASIADHRGLRVLRDAARYRSLQSKRDESTKRVKHKAKTARTIKPGAKTPTSAAAKSRKRTKRLHEEVRSSRGRAQEDAAAKLLQDAGIV